MMLQMERKPSSEGFCYCYRIPRGFGLRFWQHSGRVIIRKNPEFGKGVGIVASEYSFDIVSKVDLQEVNNAVQQSLKEIETRFDFKGSKSDLKLEAESILAQSDDDFKLKSVIDILQTKLMKRGVPIRNLDYGKVEPASGGTVRQTIKLRQGIDQDNARKINILIRDSKLKVKSQIQGDQIRITGKNKDDLQSVMGLLRGADLPLELQFSNYR
jgi:cyclic-di-GMP-binding protein